MKKIFFGNTQIYEFIRMSSVFPTENQLSKQNKFKQPSTFYTWAGNFILTGEMHKTPSIQDATETETDVTETNYSCVSSCASLSQ